MKHPERQLARDRYLDSPLVEKLTDGSILCWLRVGAADRSLDYGDHQETVKAEVLFDSESISTLKGVPVTLEHPPGFFFENIYQYGGASAASLPQAGRDDVRGIVLQEFRKEGAYLTVAACIFDKETIEAIENGKVEVSPGYSRSTIKDSAGIIYQTERVYDHIAIVTKGRAGKDVSVKLDSTSSSNSESIPSEIVTDMKREIKSDDTSTLSPGDILKFLKQNPSGLASIPDSELENLESIEALQSTVTRYSIAAKFESNPPLVEAFMALHKSMTGKQQQQLSALLETIDPQASKDPGDGDDAIDADDDADDDSEDDTIPDLVDGETEAIKEKDGNIDAEIDEDGLEEKPKKETSKDSSGGNNSRKGRDLKATKRGYQSSLESARSQYIKSLSSAKV